MYPIFIKRAQFAFDITFKTHQICYRHNETKWARKNTIKTFIYSACHPWLCFSAKLSPKSNTNINNCLTEGNYCTSVPYSHYPFIFIYYFHIWRHRNKLI